MLHILSMSCFTLAFCIMRIAGSKGDLFKTCAHLYVAYLIGRCVECVWRGDPKKAGIYFFFAGVLSSVETVAFIASR